MNSKEKSEILDQLESDAWHGLKPKRNYSDRPSNEQKLKHLSMITACHNIRQSLTWANNNVD